MLNMEPGRVFFFCLFCFVLFCLCAQLKSLEATVSVVLKMCAGGMLGAGQRAVYLLSATKDCRP